MKTLVIGGSGYLGSYVVKALLNKKYDVTVYDKTFKHGIISEDKFIKGDINDFDYTSNVIKGFDFVFLFAGVADIKEGNREPMKTFNTNVMSLVNILESCTKNKIKRFIYASSIYVYSEIGSFYKTSKQCAELIIETFSTSKGLNYSILRYGSLYGPGANDFNFIYNAVKQALIEKKITRKGDGSERRDYIHVSDAALATIKELHNKNNSEYLMLTGYQSMKVKNVLLLIKEILGNDIDIEYLPGKMTGHYKLTPYSFKPKVAKKVVLDNYYDLGQGILECMDEINEKIEG